MVSQQRARGSTVDPDEVARFDEAAAEWWNPRGPMRVLHRFNPVRLAYIRDLACRRFHRDARRPEPLAGVSVLDIGCGGGVLSEPLARLGGAVTGIDPAARNIAVARAHAEKNGLAIEYRDETVESVVAAGRRFDIVLAMEVIEHVTDADAFLAASAEAVKPGGLLVMASINRTLRAFALAVVGAEYLLGWLPKGTHRWERFVTPDEIADALSARGVAVIDTAGVVYHPLADEWRLSRDTGINYMVAAARA